MSSSTSHAKDVCDHIFYFTASEKRGHASVHLREDGDGPTIREVLVKTRIGLPADPYGALAEQENNRGSHLVFQLNSPQL